MTGRQRRPGVRISEPEPRSEAGERPPLAKSGGERLGALRPWTGIPRASGGHRSLALTVVTNCCLNRLLGIHSQLSRGETEGLVAPQYHRASQGQGKPRTPVARFPASAAQLSGRHGGRTPLGSGSSSASNLPCGLQVPSPVWVSEMPTIAQSSCYQICKITSAKVVYNL